MTRRRLFSFRRSLIARGMRAISFSLSFVAVLCLAIAALGAVAAQTTKPAAKAHPPRTGPKAIGTFEDWTAATNKEAGQTVCYAFTRVQSSAPTLPGRGDVVLTVTERPGGRDAVAISAGFAYAANAAVAAVVDQQATLEFYTAQRSAFARDGRAAVQAFIKGNNLVATSPTPKAGRVTDTFSLRGFNAAYAAIVKACPVSGKAGT